jgi:16S rRNA (cytidine1402-2'-O)-methyltransferase
MVEPGRESPGSLYVVATPLGNLQDITLRALDVLKRVDAVAAEDTRITARLLEHYGIAVRQMIPLHEHNEQRQVPRVLELLAAGSSVALTSDAGTPGFCDPGARLVAAARVAGHAVVPIPGPNAAAAAISASGFGAQQFLFCGFLPAKPGERRRTLEELSSLPYLLVFFEAPHRVLETLADLARSLGGERRIVIARELTKLFENIHACTLGEAADWVSADPARRKGEFVLLVEGAPAATEPSNAAARHTLVVLLESLPPARAAALAAKLTGARRSELYALALELKRRGGESARRG